MKCWLLKRGFMDFFRKKIQHIENLSFHKNIRLRTPFVRMWTSFTGKSVQGRLEMDLAFFLLIIFSSFFPTGEKGKIRGVIPRITPFPSSNPLNSETVYAITYFEYAFSG